MTNWIQNHILLELTKNSNLRYSQLKPRDIEGNLFMYHLKGLMKEGYIEKADGGQYQLSSSGMRLVATLSLKTGKTRIQPQILNAIVAVNEKGEHLLLRWKRQPNMNLISFPHGMMHHGQSVFDMAHQELAEKTGLQAELQYRGDVYVRVQRAEVTERHMLIHLFEAEDIHPGREDELRPELAECFWAPFETMKREEFIPGFYEIAQLTMQQKALLLEEVALHL